MKKSIFFILVIILFIGVSSYRFIQLNASIWKQRLNTEIKYGEKFNLNGVDIKLNKVEKVNNTNSSRDIILKTTINLYKNGEISNDGFYKKFPECYPDFILLNITNKDGTLVRNYSSEYEGYLKDNPNFAKIQKGEKSIGKEKENLILKFKLEKKMIEDIKNNQYNIKLAFPLDERGFKFNYINLTI